MFPLLDQPGPCRVCGQDRLRALHVYPNERRRLARSENLALMGCDACGVLFSHPAPTPAEIARHYSDASGFASKFARWDTAEVQRRREAKIRRCSAEYRLLSAHLEGVRPGEEPHPRVLDFGCGKGEWMDVLAARGWRTVGLEPSSPLHAHAARRHAMIDALPRTGTFDLVIANRVLEHLDDPVTTVRRIAECLVPGGYLYVTVPDFGRLPEHGRFSYVTNDVHIVSYTAAGLASVLALADLEVVEEFRGPEWDAISRPTRDGLRFLARWTGTVRPPAADPLHEAVAALRGYQAGPHEGGEQPDPGRRHRAATVARAVVAVVWPRARPLDR